METRRKVNMLTGIYPLVYNDTPQRSDLWKQGHVLVARLKNHTVIFTNARREKMAMQSNAKYADWLKIGNITKKNLRSFLQNMKDGLREILKRFLSTRELITKEIVKESWRNLKNQEKKMDTQQRKLIERGIRGRLKRTIMWHLPLNLVILLDLKHVINVKKSVSHKLTIMIMKSHWKLFGFVQNVMEKSIGYVYQRERLNLETSNEDVIVQTTEETCRGELEAAFPPRNWSVSKLLLKVIEWLRHTAGCTFYQGQCVTNDLWLNNLRSTAPQ